MRLAVKSRRALALSLTIAAAVAPLFAADAAAERALSLPDLERRLENAPAILAARDQYEAAHQDVRYHGARASRYDYFFSNGLGPRSDIVINNETNNAFRYAQRAGIRLPILGTRQTAQVAAVEARSREELARIDARSLRLQLLGQLRDDYIAYWGAYREQKVLQKYVTLEGAFASAARALRRDGFWTQGQYLDFLDYRSRFGSEVSVQDASRRASLAQIRGIVAEDVAELRPMAPDFVPTCNPAIEATVDRAVAADGEAAQLAVLLDVTKQSLGYTKHSSIASDVEVGVGTAFDVPRGVGYDVTAGLDLTVPQHTKVEEDSARAQLVAQADSYRERRAQRVAEVRAAVLKAMEDLAAAQRVLAQDRTDLESKKETLREARVQLATQVTQGATGFGEVQTALADAYTADRAAAAGTSELYLRLNGVEKLSPSTCLPERLGPVPAASPVPST